MFSLEQTRVDGGSISFELEVDQKGGGRRLFTK